MKTTLPSMLVLCFAITFNSCTISKNAIESSSAAADSKKVSICYVQMHDGAIKNYTSLKLVTGVFKTPHLVADGNIIIKTETIKAYQDKDHYAISQRDFSTEEKSYVAKETLPGFAVRVASGKLNVYAVKYYNGHNTSEKLYLQLGNDGAILPYKYELMNDLVKDNAEAYKFFNAKKHTANVGEKIVVTASIYNSAGLFSKN